MILRRTTIMNEANIAMVKREVVASTKYFVESGVT